MPGFLTRLTDGWDHASRNLLLAAVPMVLALSDAEKLRSILSFDGFHVGFKLGTPLSVVTLWQFVSVPQTGVSVDAGVPLESLPVAVVTVPALLVVQAALTAGYFGSLEGVLSESGYDFWTNVRAYLLPFLLLTVIPFLALLPLALGVFGLGAVGGSRSVGLVVLPAIAVFVAAVYLFYATPYLVVLRDAGLLEAASASYRLAVQGGPYLSYFLGFALFVLAVSPLATVFVVNVPVLGLVVGIVGGGVLGLTANLATMRFVADVDPASPSFGSWDDDGDSDGGDDSDSDGGDGSDDGNDGDSDSDDGDDGDDSDDGNDGDVNDSDSGDDDDSDNGAVQSP